MMPLSASILFSNQDEILAHFQETAFTELRHHHRFHAINQAICQLIQDTPSPCFLLPAVIHLLHRINGMSLLSETLDMASFEFWLNQFSTLSEEAQQQLRGKIVGRYLPRETYQSFFPIGMGRIHRGSHFIAAHLSPDVDTMVASLWGWIDAFGARVSSGLHLWCLPGGPPDSPVTQLLETLLGRGLFSSIARPFPALTLTAMDLMTQQHFVKETGHKPISLLEHEESDHAIILVDERGSYLGDWRSGDVERIRQATVPFKASLHWFEHHLQAQLIALFSREKVTIEGLDPVTHTVFEIPISESEPAREFTATQRQTLARLFQEVMGLEKGLHATFGELIEAFDRLGVIEPLQVKRAIEQLGNSGLFDAQGAIREERPALFQYLKVMMGQLNHALFLAKQYVERLDVVLTIKYRVLASPHTYVTLRSDVEEIYQKMEGHEFLTVVTPEGEDCLFPLGIVRARDLRSPILGTVTLRDFCNREEAKMASYLQVISVVDHHKSQLSTPTVPTALIGDVQSCNVLIAEVSMAMNDQYSMGGMTEATLEREIATLSAEKDTTPRTLRLLQRLLQRRLNAHHRNHFYVHPAREHAEYFSYLQAILDDTDLLTKVSCRDLNCVVQLVNRLISLEAQCEREVIDLDRWQGDSQALKEMAQHILQHPAVYPLYAKVYALREEEAQRQLEVARAGDAASLFLDTKEQNGCARVGQTKWFASNFAFYLEHADAIRQQWYQRAEVLYKEKPEIDLHLHMLSTIASADEVYRNEIGPYSHKDELWIWIPATPQGYAHFNTFATGFQVRMKELASTAYLEIAASAPHEFVDILSHHFHSIARSHLNKGPSGSCLAVFHFKAGALNSRKAMITPYLPRL